MSTTEIPEYVNSDSEFGIQATIGSLDKKVRATSGIEHVLFLGDNASKPRYAITANRDRLDSKAPYLALEYYDTALQRIFLPRQGWQREMLFPKIDAYTDKPRPQAMHFIDENTLVITGHYKDIKSRAFKIDLTTNQITGEFLFDAAHKHVANLAQSANGDVWFSDYTTFQVARIDLAQSFATGQAVFDTVCNFSYMQFLSSIGFITIGSVEYFIASEFNTVDTAKMYLLPASRLASTYTFNAANAYKYFVIGQKVQGLTIHNDSLYLSRNRDHTGLDHSGYVERYDNISNYFANNATGSAIVPSASFYAPSNYPEDCKFRPNTNEFWTSTEGRESLDGDNDWLAIWSSDLDDSKNFATYTLNRTNNDHVLMIDNVFYKDFTATPSIQANVMSIGALPNVVKGIQNGFSTATIRNVALSDKPVNAANYENYESGNHEPNNLTVIDLPIVDAATGWTNEIGGVASRDFSPAPFEGVDYINGGLNAQTIARQRFDVAALSAPNSLIGAYAIVSWHQSTWSGSDLGSMGARTIDGNAVKISEDYGDIIATPTNGTASGAHDWYSRAMSKSIEGNAQFVDVLFRADRYAGNGNDVDVDAVSAKIYIK
ncbi:hypothetical protein [Psychrobacter sp. PP-21]|uniref:hypothetical protein n=1 Tax=Psychrobacter sp. PP-21 TaxID=2957503 RepID=UPI0029C03723|nr:hypothetical protein [Psychrobacter sp. PP-21]